MPTPYPNIASGEGLARLEFTLAGANHDPMVIIGYQQVQVASALEDADDIFESFVSTILPDLSTALTLVNVHVVRNVAGVLQESDTDTTPTNGGTAGQTVPANTSILVPKQTGQIGRHFRGRMYLPGLPISAADATGSFIRGTPLAAYQLDAANFLSALTTAGVPMMILHRSPLIPATVVTGLGVEQLLATQSRRLRKVAHR